MPVPVDYPGTKIEGVGVTAALLIANGIQVFSQHQLVDADQLLR